MVTRESLRVLHNKLTFLRTIGRQFDSEFKGSGKIGDTLKLRLPMQFTYGDSETVTPQSLTEKVETLTMARRKNCSFQISSLEELLDVENRNRIIDQAISGLASQIEADCLSLVYPKVYNHAGSPGTSPASLTVIGQTKAMLNKYLCPQADRKMLVTSDMTASLINALASTFNPQKEIGKQYLEGEMGRAQGFDWMETELLPSHTSGSRDNTTPLVNGASQTGTSLIIDGLDASVTIAEGDTFTIDAVYAVNPETKKVYSHLQQFTVTAAATGDGSGNATLSISPSIITSGAYQNVSAGPADAAVIIFTPATASTAYQFGLAYHPEAFAFVMGQLPLKSGADKCYTETWKEANISLRVWADSVILTDQTIYRIDAVYGMAAPRPELATRLWGGA
jgi:hypothetical protein